MRFIKLKGQKMQVAENIAPARPRAGDNLPKEEDVLLMIKVAEGSEHALRMLIEKWKNPLVNYFYRSTGDLHESEDLAQQTFINLYRARQSYEPLAKFSTYLFRIARNVFINERRKRACRPSGAMNPSEMEAPFDGRSELARSELEEVFYDALRRMPENQRTAILLLKQQELSYDEIAKIMDAKVAAVKTWIFRARQILRETLENNFTEK